MAKASPPPPARGSHVGQPLPLPAPGAGRETEEPGAPGSRGKPSQRPYFKGALFAGGEVGGEGWESVGDRSVLWVTPDWRVGVESF